MEFILTSAVVGLVLVEAGLVASAAAIAALLVGSMPLRRLLTWPLDRWPD